jgi:hypothetical protein
VFISALSNLSALIFRMILSFRGPIARRYLDNYNEAALSPEMGYCSCPIAGKKKASASTAEAFFQAIGSTYSCPMG